LLIPVKPQLHTERIRQYVDRCPTIHKAGGRNPLAPDQGQRQHRS
jgi:hypothetical protein